MIRALAHETEALFGAISVGAIEVPGPIVATLVTWYGGSGDEGRVLFGGWSGCFRAWFIEEGGWDEE